MAATGGARRLKVPPTDLGHLEDLLADVVKKEVRLQLSVLPVRSANPGQGTGACRRCWAIVLPCLLTQSILACSVAWAPRPVTACTQAVVGSDLAVLTSFIEKLMLAQPMLLFKYQDLKNVFQRLVLTFPCLRENYPGQDSSAIAKKLAEQTMTLACMREGCETRRGSGSAARAFVNGR